MDVQYWLTYARKFGTDCLIESVVELGCNEDQLTELISGLDDLEREKRGAWAPKRRLSARIRARRALGLPDEETA